MIYLKIFVFGKGLSSDDVLRHLTVKVKIVFTVTVSNVLLFEAVLVNKRKMTDKVKFEGAVLNADVCGKCILRHTWICKAIQYIVMYFQTIYSFLGESLHRKRAT